MILDDYVWSAGVATDLVNTAALVWSDGHDRLPDTAALREFLADHGLPPLGADGAAADRELVAVHRLRDRLRAVLEHPEPARATDLAAAAGTLTISAPERSWSLTVPDGTPPRALLSTVAGAGVLGALLHLGPERFRRCEAGCLGLFIDTSRAGRRRFCMPRLCGSRVNAANYRARQRNTHS
ncbi:CGNR zinc finger domain-containing protein [Amycolatopsis sp. NBC_00345]|uniref:CGNR zinc finger domain-containing protein n=1 Tax=Amycolatopsis sp. NBC_00345 TaxID=2975955 RepID=UPI002E272D4E